MAIASQYLRGAKAVIVGLETIPLDVAVQAVSPVLVVTVTAEVYGVNPILKIVAVSFAPNDVSRPITVTVASLTPNNISPSLVVTATSLTPNNTSPSLDVSVSVA